MGFFESEDTAPVTAVRRPGDGYCPVCHRYAITSLHQTIWDPQTNQTWLVCEKIVCLDCNKKKGRLIGLYTSSDGYHTDFSMRHAKLPKGVEPEWLRRAVEKSPLTNAFTPGEVAQYRKELYGRYDDKN